MSLTSTIQPPYKNYLLDRKLVSIHTEDRDINKYPNNNQFDIQLPEDMINVQSIRLVQIDLPSNQYVFSNNNQNIKLAFTLQPDISSVLTASGELKILQDKFDEGLPSNLFEITINEGSYTPQELANEIQTNLNLVIENYAISQGVLSTDASYNYNHFNIIYDKPKNKLIFANDRDYFTFYFNYKHTYENLDCGQKVAINLPSNWGLGYYLGFEKQSYNSSPESELFLKWYPSTEPTTSIPTPYLIPSSDSSTNQIYVLESPHLLKINGEQNIYMEIDKYNSIDELEPYSISTTTMYNNDYGGKVNSAFAKIPIYKDQFQQTFNSLNNNLFNTTQFRVPQKKIRVLRFRFRYHDGRLVDFQNYPFSFTLEFNQLIEEQLQDQNLYIRKPEFYRQL